MEKLGHLRRVRTVLLTSRDAAGKPAHTVVQLAVADDDVGYLRTPAGSALARRLATFPDVRIAPCSIRGKAGGSDQPCRALAVSGVSATAARRTLARKSPVIQGILLPLWYRLRGLSPCYVRLAPTDEPTPWL